MTKSTSETNVIWKPLAGSQSLAMSCPADIILLDGSRGYGKSDAQIMMFMKNVGKGYGYFWKGIIFDREYKSLEDLVTKTKRWFPEFDNGAKFKSSKSDYKWVWPTGEELLFRTMKTVDDYHKYHGQEYAYIGWNELTKWPTSEYFDLMMSCNRTSFRPEDFPQKDANGNTYLLPEIPLVVIATTNPSGIGSYWVKKRFIDVAPMGTLVKQTTMVFNPRTQKREPVTKTQCRIFGNYRENIYLAPEYIASLENIDDDNLRKAWLLGDWNINFGGIFEGRWDSYYNVVEPFDIPKNWRIDRSFDWGSSKPFSVGWWAESDGTDVKLRNGKWRSTVRGDLFRIGEWYGSTGKPNEGLKLMSDEISKGIVERELAMGIHGRVKAGPADNSIWDEYEGSSIASIMAKPVNIDNVMYNGVEWLRSNKRKGSRVQGWDKMGQYMRNARPTYVETSDGGRQAIPREYAGLFVFNTCKYFIDLVPILPRDDKNPDDVDTNSEDHIGDEARYRILGADLGAKSRVTTTG